MRRDAEPAGIAPLVNLATWIVALIVGALVAFSAASTAGATRDFAAYAWRFGSLLFAAALVAASWRELGHAQRFLALFAPWIAALFSLAVIRFGDLGAWSELFRHIYMLAIGACAFAAAKRPAGRLIISRTMWVILVALLVLSLEPATELLAGGWSWQEARIYKAVALSEGVGFNSILFIEAMLLVGLWAGQGASKAIWAIAATTFVATSVLFATRTPILSLFAAAILLVVMQRMLPGRITKAMASSLTLILLAVPFAIIATVVLHPDPDVGRFLTGRTPLWQISVAVWEQSPLIGVGSDALNFGMQRELNAGAFRLDYERAMLSELAGGGYHNIWLDALASKGLLGFLGLSLSFFLVLRAAFLNVQAPLGGALLMLSLMLLTRGYVEVSGLFSYENSPLDFVAMSLLGWTLAMASWRADLPAERRRRAAVAPGLLRGRPSSAPL